QLTAVYRTPTISLNPSTAPASTIVTVTGTNFASSSTVTISYDSTAVSTSPTTITTDSSGAFTATFTVPSSSTTGIHTVTAKDASSHPASSQFTVSTTSSTAPGPPTGLSATAASSSQINLSWIAPANNGGSAITGYKIERSADNGITWSTPVSNTASTTYSDAGLVASTAYTYRVSAINLVGTSSPSTTTSATTPGNTSAGTSTLTVAKQDSAGNTLTSLYIALYQGGTTVTTGYSPTTFTLNNNVQYSVQAYGYNTHVFDHWKDNGSTTNPRPMTINANTQITAVYRTPTISLNPS